MILKSSTLKPGLLVALRTSVTGNVRHSKTVLDEGSTDERGRFHQEWQTERVVFDPEEYKAACEVRDRVRGWVANKCIQTSFTLLCPENKVEDLEAAYNDALREINLFNANSKVTRVSLNLVTALIAADDVKAMRAINAEIRELLEGMTDGVAQLDAKAIRLAATKAKNVGKMLTPVVEERLGEAIKTARKVATKLIAAGEEAALKVDEEAVKALTEARTAFLDLDGDTAVTAPAAEEARTLDFEPEGVPECGSEEPAPERVALELD